MTELDIICVNDPRGDWTCDVAIAVDDRPATMHRVRVTADVLTRLAPKAGDPHILVDRSFRFLLEREAPTSILRSFDLTDIGRYFPEYEATMRQA